MSSRIIHFNPRPPHGGRQREKQKLITQLLFQPTSSAWRTTLWCNLIFAVRDHFNPRPPHGGRPQPFLVTTSSAMISTHVLRMEDDSTKTYQRVPTSTFQPTSSAWRTTYCEDRKAGKSIISTHVLRMEDD